MGSKLMAMVAEGERGRVYLPPNEEMEAIARKETPKWKPDILISGSTQYLGVKPYGMDLFSKLFTNRQLVALTTLSDLVLEARERVKRDALVSGLPDDGTLLSAGGNGADAYGDAVGLYLAFAISKLTDYATTLCRWFPERDSARSTFSRQALSMSWDYTKLNPVHDATGSFRNGYTWVAECV
jgi:putative DNA methylase